MLSFGESIFVLTFHTFLSYKFKDLKMHWHTKLTNMRYGYDNSDGDDERSGNDEENSVDG